MKIEIDNADDGMFRLSASSPDTAASADFSFNQLFVLSDLMTHVRTMPFRQNPPSGRGRRSDSAFL